MNGATAKGPTNNRPNIFWPSTFRESGVPKFGVLKLFVSISSRRNMMGKSHLNLGRKIWPVTVLLIFIAVNIIIFNEFVAEFLSWVWQIFAVLWFNVLWDIQLVYLDFIVVHYLTN